MTNKVLLQEKKTEDNYEPKARNIRTQIISLEMVEEYLGLNVNFCQ